MQQDKLKFAVCILFQSFVKTEGKLQSVKWFRSHWRIDIYKQLQFFLLSQTTLESTYCDLGIINFQRVIMTVLLFTGGYPKRPVG
jgi:hypothetical protein